MKKVSIANIIISIIIVIIAGVLFYNNRYNISNDMDNTCLLYTSRLAPNAGVLYGHGL